MSEPLNINDLINGKEDLDTIAEVAMVGTLDDTTINRQGVQVDTIEGRLKKIGFAPPLAYAAGITFTGPLDAVKTVDNGGIIYGCLASARPFTTTGNFANDVASFFVVQDGNQAVGDVRTDASNTYQAGTTQSFDTATANTFNLGGQDLGDKLAEIDQFYEVGVPVFIDSASNGGSAFSYARGSVCLYNNIQYRSLVDDNTDQDPETSAKWMNVEWSKVVAVTPSDPISIPSTASPTLIFTEIEGATIDVKQNEEYEIYITSKSVIRNRAIYFSILPLESADSTDLEGSGILSLNSMGGRGLLNVDSTSDVFTMKSTSDELVLNQSPTDIIIGAKQAGNPDGDYLMLDMKIKIKGVQPSIKVGLFASAINANNAGGYASRIDYAEITYRRTK